MSVDTDLGAMKQLQFFGAMMQPLLETSLFAFRTTPG